MTDSCRGGDFNVGFRVDGSVQLGSGHVMRCLTLARELTRRGATVQFFCKVLPGNLIERIEGSGFVVQRLPADEVIHANRDAAETLTAAGVIQFDWLIVDHYFLGAEWERQVRQCTHHVLAIDDLAGRSHDCDIVLDFNWRSMEVARESYTTLTSDCCLLLGPRYALLQAEYALYRRQLQTRRNSIERIIIFFGGSDITDETGKALAALSEPAFAHLAADIVIGANYPQRDALMSRVSARPGTTLHENLPSLAGLMMQADLAIGAGGVTTWERICLNLYTLVTTLAANQESSIEALAKAGVVHWIGRSTETTAASYYEALQRHMEKQTEFVPIVDGFGTKRVAELIMPTHAAALSLRTAQLHDAFLFFEWRNDPIAQAMSFSIGRVSWDEHMDWFRHKCSDGNTILYVLEADGLPVGQARADFEAREAVLSYSIDPLVRGRGWGRWLVREAATHIQQLRSIGIRAHVKSENTASRKIFTGLGWNETVDVHGHLMYRLPIDRSTHDAKGKAPC